jgi:hypothetical protein
MPQANAFVARIFSWVRDLNVEPSESVAEPRPAGSATTSALVLAFVVALPAGRGSVFRIFLHAFHIYVAFTGL